MPGQDNRVGPHRTASVPWRTGQLMDIQVPHRLSVLTIWVNVTPQVWGMSVRVYVLWIWKSMCNDSIMGLVGWFSSWWNIYSTLDDRPVGGSVHLIPKDSFTYIQERDCESSKTNKQNLTSNRISVLRRFPFSTLILGLICFRSSLAAAVCVCLCMPVLRKETLGRKRGMFFRNLCRLASLSVPQG